MKNWEDHRTFLPALSSVLHETAQAPCLVAGDFNQRFPRSRQPREVADLLEKAFEDFETPTAGERRETGRMLIGHTAISSALERGSVTSWAGETDGKKKSDHDEATVAVGFSGA